MYAVLVLNKFDNAFKAKGFLSKAVPVDLKIDAEGLAGFFPVYERREEAERDFPGAHILEVQLDED